MELPDWIPIYDKICRDMGHNPGDDTRGAITLSGLLTPAKHMQGMDALCDMMTGKNAIVLGPVLSEEEVKVIQEFPEAHVLVAADSSLTLIKQLGLEPDLVVTDLDGPEDLLKKESKKGTLLAIHAHGDNIPLLIRLVPEFEGPILGTCQVVPPPPLSNFGGYTDGDRAVLMSIANGATAVYLAGFDFINPIAKPGLEDRKKKKLRWAKEIIDFERSRGAQIRKLM